MTATSSEDLRLRMVKAVEAGGTVRVVAERYEVSPSTVVKLMQRVRRTGSASPGQIGGQRKPILAPYGDVLTEFTASHKGITLAELRDEAFVARGGPRVDLSTFWHMLRRLGLTHKKKSLRAAALTLEQCERFDLQESPSKATEIRVELWHRCLGRAAKEVDVMLALHPGALTDIICDTFTPFNGGRQANLMGARSNNTVKPAMSPVSEQTAYTRYSTRRCICDLK